MKTISLLLSVLIIVTVLFFIQKREYSKVGKDPFTCLVEPPPGMYKPAPATFKFLESLAPGSGNLAKGIAWERSGTYFIRIEVPAASGSRAHINNEIRLVLDDSTYLYGALSCVPVPNVVAPGSSMIGGIFRYASGIPPGRTVTSVEIMAIAFSRGAPFPTSTEKFQPMMSGSVVRDLQRQGAHIIVCPMGPQPKIPTLAGMTPAP